jgi:hypothetical protein
MCEYNHSYLKDTDHMIGGRLIRGGLSTVPYNEIMVVWGTAAPVWEKVKIMNRSIIHQHIIVKDLMRIA